MLRICCMCYPVAMEEEIEKLEMKVSYLESQCDELNSVVIDQEKSIAILEKRMEIMERRIADLIEVTGEARPNRRPPHY